MQIIADRFCDKTALAAARFFERERPVSAPLCEEAKCEVEL